MSNPQSSYRQIMKATSLFGGVQIFSIIITIIKSKLIAVLLGPSGMGISGLLTSTTSLITGLTNFGLGISSIKEISEAYEAKDEMRISIVSIILKRLIWATGILGSIVTLVFSPWLSQITFGNKNYTFAFVCISITLLFNQISIGQTVLLRGMRQLQYMAKSSLIGSVFGLLTTIPLYYYLGIKGIVPGIIVSSLTALILTWYYSRKINIKPIFVSTLRTIYEGKGMLKMGFIISLSGLVTLGTSYIVRIFISNTGGLIDVGLYNAGFAIINTYVGMVFTAMSTDYYPRLASIAGNSKKCNITINQQAEISIIILSPIIMFFLVFVNWAVILFYSSKFVAINEMILWAALAMLFRAASWSISFVFLAKGDSKIFFWTEFSANVYSLAFNIIGYKFGGLTGLGISFLFAYIFYLVQEYIIARKNYNFSFNKEFKRIFCIQLSIAVTCFIIVNMLSGIFAYTIGSLLILISSIYSYNELNKRLDIKSILNSLKNKNIK